VTGSIMVYGLALGGLLAAAACFLDRGLRAVGLPARGVWILAMAAVAAAPLLPRGPASYPGNAGPAPSLPLASLPVSPEPGPEASSLALPTLPRGTDGPLTLLWIGSTVLILLALGWTWSRIRRSSASWPRETLRGRNVLLSNQLGPAVLGVFRPAIVLPRWVADLGSEKVDMVLLHEEAHVEARDPALLALGILMVAAAPWNPAVWWMLRRLHLAVEADCDRRVLSRGLSPRAYGSLLLEVAAGARRLSILSPALVEGGSSLLERRLLMLHSTVGRKGAVSGLLAVSVSAGLVVLACETPTPPVAEEDLQDQEQTVTVPVEVAQEGDGYFLVRKVGDRVEYVGTVPAHEVEGRESLDATPDPAFVVQEIATEGAEEAGNGIMGRGPEDGEGPRLQPLIIVDGVITDRSMADIEGEDIKSIEIVKGGAAQALYGSRAAGGVVKITTHAGGGRP